MKNRILPLRCSSSNASPEVGHSPRSRSPLHFDIRNSKFARKNNFLALGVCFPQLCWSAGRKVCRVKITCTKLPTNGIVSTTKIPMKYVVNWIPLRIRVRSRNTQPHLKVGLGIFQITSTKRCPQVWLWFDRSFFSTNFVEFDQAV